MPLCTTLWTENQPTCNNQSQIYHSNSVIALSRHICASSLSPNGTPPPWGSQSSGKNKHSKSSTAPSSTSFSRLPNLQQDCWVVRISHLRQRLGGTKLIWWGELQNWSGQNYKQVFLSIWWSVLLLLFTPSIQLSQQYMIRNMWPAFTLIFFIRNSLAQNFFSREDEMILLHPNSHLAPEE